MLRNQEVKMLLVAFLLITGLATIGAAVYSWTAALFVVVSAALLITTFLYFTYWRYREIERLSEYLRQIRAGDYTLDVRDNHEGELSILKSEIYKMTLMLLEQSEQLKKDKIHLMHAISDISHQLKTPLTSMMVMADLLEDAQLPQEKHNEFVHHLQRQLERIEWLVTSLLKLSKLDAGAVSFKKDVIHVNKLITKALEPMSILIDIKEIEVMLHGEEAATFSGDFHWTTEALINIIKNCIEHLPDRKKLDIYFSENKIYTEIIVADNGHGIAKEDLPYLFQRFYKGKNASEDSAGIGLAMAYSIIVGQNGTLAVKSVVGEGTTFHIKFYK